MNTKLQIALDDISMEDALALLEKVHPFTDIAEIGTPFMMKYGAEAVRTIRSRYPGMEILLDAKIMDAGAYEAKIGFDAGADMVTVLAVTDDRTAEEVVRAAHSVGKKAVADMICVQDLKKRVERLEELGVDIIAVHTGVDQQAMGRTPLGDLREISRYVTKAETAVAGGITPQTAEAYLDYKPAILIVGSGINHAQDPESAAKELKEIILRRQEHGRGTE